MGALLPSYLKEQKDNGVNNPKKCYNCKLEQLKIEGYE
jgi:hypothetical protein